MKKFDLTTIFVKGAEWFASLAVLNLCWILFSLPILTIIPATDTVFELLNQWSSEGYSQSVSIFKQFKDTFVLNFKKSYKRGTPLLIVSAILLLDLYFLNQLTISSAWFEIFKYAFYTFAFLLVLSLLYAIPTMKQMDNYQIRMLVLSLMMAIGNPLTTLGVIVSVIGLVFVFLRWPSMLFFYAMTGIAWIMTKAVSYIFSKNQERNQI